MPELPEVETVRRILQEAIAGKTFDEPDIVFPGMIKTDFQDFSRNLPGKKVLSVDRRGKNLLLHLSGERKLLFHLRMEGKLFVVDKERHERRHLSLFLPFRGEDSGLAFYDVRKFGTCHFLEEDEEGPLSSLGKEPFKMEPAELFALTRHVRRPVKEVIMDQTVIAGIGNIYADETLFAARISPFLPAGRLALEDCRRILEEARRILLLAIENNGATIRTYQASPSAHGDMQDFLMVYGRQGKLCPSCKRFRIEKRQLAGRGTCYCPHCQKTGITLGVTGKIGSGKSLVCSYFARLGYAVFSADDAVGDLYRDPVFLDWLFQRFPEIFTPERRIDKQVVSSRLLKEKDFRRRYQNIVFSAVKDKANAFLVQNDGKDKVLEIPLLFDAHMEKDCTFLLGTETTKQKAHLLERGDHDIETRLAFNALNSYDKNRHLLDFIIKTDFSKKRLWSEVKKVNEEIQSRKEEK